MKANLLLLRAAGLVAGAALMLATVRAADSDSFPTFASNYITIGGSGSPVSGSSAAFQRYTQQSVNGVGGIQDFNFNYDLSKNLNVDVNGKVLAGQGDYLADVKLTQTDFGTFEAGYKRFRTFYDDIGGFFPTNNIWLPISRRPLYVDRGKFFVDATLTLPNAPVFTFKYSNETRTGTKDTTIWGDSDLTGVPISSLSSRNFFPANRKILPAYLQLNERQETWEATMSKTFGNTNVLLSVGGDRIKNIDTRNIDRYVGELKPYPAIPSNPPSIIPNNFANNPNTGFDQQGTDESGYTVGGRVETTLTDQVTLYANLNYRHASADIAAARLIAGPMLTAVGLVSPVGSFTSGGRSVYSYTSTGKIKEDIVTGNIGVQYKPVPDLYLDAALRGEDNKVTGNNQATYVANYVVQATGVVTPLTYSAPQSLDNREKPWTPAVDVRYTGIRTVSLYGTWEYRSTSQDEKNGYSSIGPAGTAQAVSAEADATHIKEHHQNATVGANWSPVAMFNARAELFVKDHENRFSGFGANNLGDLYNLNYDIKGAKLSAILHALPQLTFTTRYIVQRGKAQVQDALGTITAGDSRSYTLGETVDWNPTKSTYVQANVNLVYDTIISSYPQVSGLATTVLHNADNNYWDGNVILGYAVDKSMDLQLGATYYKADNYNAALAAFTLPYGAGEQESTVTVGLKYKVDVKTVISAKVGYLNRTNDTTGGYTNFRGPAAYVSVEHAF
ncbi:MAG TPA: hypothetical protein VHE61_12295 [Opitutaceae bacterium]|nr:hypothetical protein [Opitutaceae bacterium]